ncbi:hypothetical protein H9P43_001250 [Blastocladiella emersonii ATCC 22665]|nr:hypothetical protein H9P43_001250 [Blastocladiella emersonii ATCC 22665]
MGFIARWLSILGLVTTKKSCLLVGLDAVGKSTLVQQLRPEAERVAREMIPPTVGFNVERFVRERIHFTVFDMSGNARYRDLWPFYMADVHAVIFVIDAADKARIEIVRREFLDVLRNEDLKMRKCPLLFLCNKMDLPDVMSPSEVANLLGLDGFKDRNWYLCGCSALTGDGLDDGMAWLIDQLQNG